MQTNKPNLTKSNKQKVNCGTWEFRVAKSAAQLGEFLADFELKN